MRAPTRLELSLATAATLLFILLLDALLLPKDSALFPFFYAWIGFAVTAAALAAAHGLSRLLHRPKEYYEEATDE